MPAIIIPTEIEESLPEEEPLTMAAPVPLLKGGDVSGEENQVSSKRLAFYGLM